METEGKIIEILDLRSGTTKNGKEWRSQEFILETEEQYAKKICFSLFGDKIDANPISINKKHHVSFDVTSREYNGRWYTEARAWRVTLINSSSSENSQTPPNLPFLPGNDNEIYPF